MRDVTGSASGPRSLRYAPHVAAFSLGYVMFTYAAVPSFVVSRYETSLATVGLLMSAMLTTFVFAQAPASRLVARYTTTRVLLATLVVHGVLAVALDAARTLTVLFALRAAWGFAAGLLVSVGATHIARLHSAESGTFQQGVYGGMVTLGGAVGFLLAPSLVRVADGFGIHALGALGAVVGVAMLWPHRGDSRTAATDAGGDALALRVLRNPTVLASAVCYVALISSYITLSTFVTSYFDDLGVVGPLNAAVLVVASLGRALGGPVVSHSSFDDARLIQVTTVIAAVSFGLLLVRNPLVAVLFPLAAMLAVSLPFGAVYNLAASSTSHEGTAIAFVVAAGNVAAVIVPAVTGIVLTATGSYRVTFGLLATLNGVAALSVVASR